MLKNISYPPSCNHAQHRAQKPGTTLEQLITVAAPSGSTAATFAMLERAFDGPSPPEAFEPPGRTVDEAAQALASRRP